jgi:TRAP-type C4-dicarboxylate transport system permease small subunit
MPLLRRTGDRLFALAGEAAPAALLAVVILVVTADVVGRGIFRAPLFAANEIAVIAFVWMSWLGIAGAARRCELMGVRYFVELLPAAWTRRVDAVVNLLVVLICLFVIWAGIRQIATARFTTFDLLGLPKWALTLGLTIAMVFVAFVHARRALALARGAEA